MTIPRPNKKAALVASLAIGLALLFQNCSALEAANMDAMRAAGKQTTSIGGSLQGGGSTGNGGGYDGFLYVDRLLSGKCPDGNSNRTEVLLRSDRTAVVVREGCRSVSRRSVPVSSLNYMPHNDRSLIYSNRPLDRVANANAAAQSTVLFCRTSGPAYTEDGDKVVADIIVRTTGKPPKDGLFEILSVGMILGFYDSSYNYRNRMIETAKAEFEVSNKAIGIPNTYTLTGRSLQLLVSPDAGGRLTGVVVHDPRSDSDIPEFSSPIDCYKKEDGITLSGQ